LVAYASLGAGATSFVGTFFIAPRFKQNFKEDLDWPTIYNELINNKQGKFTTATAKEAYSKTVKGCDS
jgi:hypothetical protein